MFKKVLACFALAGFVLAAPAMAGTHGSMHHDGNMPKNVSNVSDVQNMPDETIVYVQGYLTQNLGDEMYTFQDNSGTITVEIDNDLMMGNQSSPDTLVWIAAEVDRNGDVVALEAEEIQFLPAAGNQASM